jgi:hypothetical protein
MNIIICDEFAFVPSHQAEEFWASNYPTISSSTQSKLLLSQHQMVCSISSIDYGKVHVLKDQKEMLSYHKKYFGIGYPEEIRIMGKRTNQSTWYPWI